MRILIASGGTGGHIFPALALAEALKKLDEKIEIHFVSSEKGQGCEILRRAGVDFHSISAAPLPEEINILRYIRFIKSLIKSLFESGRILKEVKPAVVVGFGGYSSFVVLLLASLVGIPTLIHEQNVIMGKANSALAFFAARVAISFPPANNFYKKKFVLTGNPIRENLFNTSQEDAFRFFKFSRQSPALAGPGAGKKGPITLLIMGGSQGAHSINEAVAGMLGLFSENDRKRIQILHLSGAADRAWLEGIYKSENIDARVFDFLRDMRYAYSIAGLVIARAGAITIAELTALGVASILVPYPYAAGHQMANAKMLGNAGGCSIIEQNKLTPEGLYAAVEKLMEGQDILGKMRLNAKRMGRPYASVNLAEEVMKLSAN